MPAVLIERERREEALPDPIVRVYSEASTIERAVETGLLFCYTLFIAVELHVFCCRAITRYFVQRYVIPMKKNYPIENSWR